MKNKQINYLIITYIIFTLIVIINTIIIFNSEIKDFRKNTSEETKKCFLYKQDILKIIENKITNDNKLFGIVGYKDSELQKIFYSSKRDSCIFLIKETWEKLNEDDEVFIIYKFYDYFINTIIASTVNNTDLISIKDNVENEKINKNNFVFLIITLIIIIIGLFFIKNKIDKKNKIGKEIDKINYTLFIIILIIIIAGLITVKNIVDEADNEMKKIGDSVGMHRSSAMESSEEARRLFRYSEN